MQAVIDAISFDSVRLAERVGLARVGEPEHDAALAVLLAAADELLELQFALTGEPRRVMWATGA